MRQLTKDDAKKIYEDKIGKVDESLGFNTIAYGVIGGFVVKKFYSRNDFHCELEDQVFIDFEGRVFRDRKLVKG